MRTIRLGRDGPEVTRFGLGCMGMAGGYGPADDAESIATIHAAIESGVTLLDIADFYGMGHVELLLRDALKGGRRERAFISLKFGALRGPDNVYIGDDTRPAAMKTFLAYSLKRLNTDYIDLYQPARVTDVPIEDTVGAIADMVRAGYVRHIGLSEAGVQSIRRAHAVHPIAALQIEYSLFTRGIERSILPALRDLGIALVAYGVLGRGLISDHARASFGVGEIRTRQPRFAAENFERNVQLVDALKPIAKEKGVSIAQLALAWVRAQGEDDIMPLVGARRRDQWREGIAAADVKLGAADLARIEAAVPPAAVAGARYTPASMKHLDSEVN